MNKLNCWEFMKCGKVPGRDNKGKSGVCPVAAEASADGLNEGLGGGRLCWVVADVCCNGKVKCSDLHRETSCFSCQFRYKVIQEEGLINVCKATGEFLAKINKDKQKQD